MGLAEHHDHIFKGQIPNGHSLGPCGGGGQDIVPAQQGSRSLFDVIRSSPFVRSVVFLTIGAIGGGSFTGCSRNESSDYKSSVEAQRLLTKEAKFSTFATEATVSLEKIDGLLASRTELRSQVETAAEVVRAFVMRCEESKGVSSDRLNDLSSRLQKLADAVKAAQESPDYSQSQERLAELSKTIGAVTGLQASDFSDGAPQPGVVSKGYKEVSALQSVLFDWIHVLERDIGQLQKGVFAKSIAELASSIKGTENELMRLSAEADPVQWIKDHPSEAALLKGHLMHSLAKVRIARSDVKFGNIFEDLGNAEALFGDLLKVIPNDSSSGTPVLKAEGARALVAAASKLSTALLEDLSRELAGSLGVRPVDPPRQTAGAATNSVSSPSTNVAAVAATTSGGASAPTVVHHYHGSGFNNFLMWHYLLNNNSGYVPHGGGYYTYVPHQNVSYSGANRFRSSSSYSAFSSAAHEAHVQTSGVEGLASSSKATGSSSSSSKSTAATSANHGESSSTHASKSVSTTKSTGSSPSKSGGFGGSGSKGFGG